MSLRKRLLFTALFISVTLAAFGSVKFYTAKLGVPRAVTRLRVAALAATIAPLFHNRTANNAIAWPELIHGRGKSHTPSIVPIQFKDPKSLGLGKMLVASRSLRDPNFAETVVLLVHYDENGVLGLILNRRTNVPVSQLFDSKSAKNRTDMVYLGGPVGTSNVFALFQSSVKIEKAENVLDDIYLISQKSVFEKILSGQPDPGVFHVYVGYAGWTEDQLRTEVQSGAWFVFPADATTVFRSDPDSLWLQMIRKTEMRWATAEPAVGISGPGESDPSRGF